MQYNQYLHLYPNISCINPTTKEQGYIYSIQFGQEYTAFVDITSGNNRRTTIYSNEWKIILRPLSSITKEEVAELMGIDGFIKKGNWLSPFFQILWEDENYVQQFDFKYIHQLTAENFRYLLSLHFDLFDLIPSGLALEKQQEVKK